MTAVSSLRRHPISSICAASEALNRRTRLPTAMAEEAGEEEADEPGVELGEAASVDGAPLARVASRLTWPVERSEVVRKEGDTVVRTTDGPRELVDILESVGTTYFASRQEFVAAVRDVAGVGPMPTE